MWLTSDGCVDEFFTTRPNSLSDWMLHSHHEKRKERVGTSGILVVSHAKRSGKILTWSAVVPSRRLKIKTACECCIKHIVLSVWYFSPTEAYNSDNFVYICHLRYHGRSSKCFRTSSGFTSPKTGEGRSLKYSDSI